MSMFKVSEVAEKLNVSRGTVYYHLKKLDNHVYKDGGTTVIDTEGFNLIQGMINSQDQPVEDLTKEKEDHTTNTDIQELKRTVENLQNDYKELVDTLKNQLEEKDRQLAKKDDLLQNFQVIVRQNQERILELEGEVQKNKPVWERITGFFNRKK